MAHVVGVPRRDPCQKCQLPVFLAERLTVGKKVFHRTCLKCARCGSQLTLGSFYETEVDDVFCCETCPDEEFEDNLNDDEASSSSRAALRQKNNNEDESTPKRNVRSSIADRLAFFEQNKSSDTTATKNGATSKQLLGKSLSDEEKTQSLQQTATTTTSYKRNKALTNFLNDTIDGDGETTDTEESSELSSMAQTKNATSMETSDSEEVDNDDVKESIEHITDLTYSSPPELPKTQPPLDDDLLKTNDELESKRFTATAELKLSTTIADNTMNSPPIALDNINTEANDDKPNNNENEIQKSEISSSSTIQTTEAHKSQTHNSVEYLDVSKTNVNESVTKDRNADATQRPDGQTQTDNKDEENIDDVKMRRKSSSEKLNANAEDKATTERLSVVRARLQQFEEITNNKNNNNNSLSNSKCQSPEKDKIIQDNFNENHKLNNVDTNVINTDKGSQQQRMDVNVITSISSATLKDEKVVEEVKQEEEEAENKTEMPKSMLQETEQQIEETNDNAVATTSTPKPSPRNVPLNSSMERKDDKLANRNEIFVSAKSIEKTAKPKVVSSPKKSPVKSKIDDYPEDLNPFKSDDEDDALSNKENTGSHYSISKKSVKSEKSENSNPFDSSDDEIELEKSFHSTSSVDKKRNSVGKVRPPRPPPPRISRNPFDEDDAAEENFSRQSSLRSSAKKRTPIPTPRTNLSQNPTPEATPRLTNKAATPHSLGLHNNSDYYGSQNSLGHTTSLHRNSEIRGSCNSLTYSSGGTIRPRKNRKAPAPPSQPPAVKELFPSTETIGSKASTPCSSTVGSPKMSRKKRPAPAPPKPSRLEPNTIPKMTHDLELNGTGSKNLHSYPLQSVSESKLSDEEKALLEGKTDASPVVLRKKSNDFTTAEEKLAAVYNRNSRRLIPLDATLLKDAAENAHEAQCDDQKQQLIDQDEQVVVYRRTIMPASLKTPTHERNSIVESLNSQDRQSEKLKDNKEAKNRNRQSQQSASSGAEDADTATYNKSIHGKWKRRKGPAPALPVPPRKVLQMLPLQEIRHELEIIEMQQQGLEKQGVVLEQMIRDRCEGQRGELLNSGPSTALADAGGGGDCVDKNSAGVQNSKEVEDLILQLFELVNEKNELFRRQAELMYLRRQHRLEQEQADLEYEIRVLMAQPERNKTDTDKAREEALIARLVNVVQLRNEVIECLEMDRLREAEEDLSIKQRLEQHSAKRNGTLTDETDKKSASKLSKKEKKKQKEAKKLNKNKKIDADKDADESELKTDKQKLKKKRKFLF